MRIERIHDFRLPANFVAGCGFFSVLDLRTYGSGLWVYVTPPFLFALVLLLRADSIRSKAAKEFAWIGSWVAVICILWARWVWWNLAPHYLSTAQELLRN